MTVDMAGVNGVTEGCYRVGVSFNPSGSIRIDEVKLEAARLIDDMLAIVAKGGDAARSAALAATHIEIACMLTVKAIAYDKD